MKWWHRRMLMSAITDESGAERRFLARISSRPGGLLLRRGAQDLLQLTALVHLHHDVRVADEFAFDVQLRDGGPVAVFLDALAHAVVFQHVDRGDRLRV